MTVAMNVNIDFAAKCTLQSDKAMREMLSFERRYTPTVHRFGFADPC